MTTTEAASARLSGRLTERVDVGSLVAFRVLFGLLVAVSAGRFFVYGWIPRFFDAPTFFFKYWGFAWVPLPPWGIRAHLAVVGLLGLCLAGGVFYRVTAPLLFVAFTHLQLIDASLYLNHYYLVSLLALLCCVLPLGRAASFDTWRNPDAAVTTFPAWCLYLVRFQVALVYIFAALAKVSSDWLIHAQPLNIWLQSRVDMPVVGAMFSHWWFALLLSWAGFLYDLTIVGWLSWRRTRLPAFGALIVFHTFTHLLFDIGMFPLIMTTVALVFFPADWPRRWIGRTKPKRGDPDRGEPDRSKTERPPELHSALPRWGLVLLGAWAVLHVAMPLRHWLYPGDVNWTEEGMRWSWRVKVHEKNGALTYFVTLPSGKRKIVRPARYLRDYQEREMSTQPAMILQLAHHIRDDFAARGQGAVEVRAEAIVSLNGRPSAPLIDKTVDLARVDSGLSPARWILPLPETEPRHLGVGR